MRLTLRINDSAAQADIKRLIDRVADMTPFFQDVGEFLTREIDDEFRNERTMGEKSWAPLATSTLRQKQRQKKILKIWQRTGATRATLIYQASRDRVIVGVNTQYAQYVNYGTRRMPARELIPSVLPPRVVSEIEAIGQDYLES